MDPQSSLAPSGSQSSLSSTIPVAQPSVSAVLLISTDRHGLVAIEVSAETFTLFPKMPTELRLKVWNQSVEESQAVCLEHNVYKSDVRDDGQKAFTLENKSPLPSALFINKESRAEVLKRHTIIYRSGIPASVKFGGLRPICAKASDVFWIEFITMMNSAGDLHDWLSALKTHNPRFMAKITKLEVRGTFTQMFFIAVLDTNRKKCFETSDPFRKLICGSFLLFPALKEINFTGMSGDTDWVTPGGQHQLEKLKTWIVNFLERSKIAFELNGCVAPTVTFRPFKTFQQVINEQLPRHPCVGS